MYRLLLISLLLLINTKVVANYVDYIVGEGDVISINVYRSPDLKTDVRVSADGMIAFPLIGKVKAAEKTTSEIEAAISKALIEKKLLVSPQVNVFVTEYQSKTFTVFGHVTTPGKYPIDRPIKLTDAIAIAGGYTLTASDVVTVTSSEGGKTSKHEYNVKHLLNDMTGQSNPEIKNGDIVQVPKHMVFYIHGQVNTPGEYKIEPNMRISQAIAMGGGVTLRGTTRDITVERIDQNGKLMKLRAKLDMILEPNDVIFVDESLF